MRLFPVPTEEVVADPAETDAAPELAPEPELEPAPPPEPLGPQPAPRPYRTLYSIDEVSRERKTNCTKYDGCLDLAVRERWEGFSCKKCEAFVALTPLQERRQVRGLLAIYDVGRAADE